VADRVKTRRYDSSARRQQAAATRTRILGAAADLFAAKGYAGTTVAEVARRADVSVDTLYASVGRKPEMLLAVHDTVLGSGAPVPAEQRDYVVAIRETEGARAKIELYAAALGRLLPHAVPISEALRVAGATDEACRAVRHGLDERRARNMHLFAADLRATGELRDDLTDDDVADIVWSMNSSEYYLLVTGRGRSPEQYAAFVADVWTRTLLR